MEPGSPGREEASTIGPRDFLNRFRPAGTPGAAARPGVPADRVTEAAAELGPVLDLLAAVEAECDRLREEGRRDAEETRAGAREQAAALLASARARADSERAVSAARARTRAGAEAARLLEDAERHAAGLRELAERRMPVYVTRVVAMVQAAGAGEPAWAGGGAVRRGPGNPDGVPRSVEAQMGPSVGGGETP
jgi:vacuolar-type H+-ATPase subunit H